MKKYSVIFHIILIIILSSCSGTSNSSDFSDIFNHLSKAKNFNEIKNFYSKGTLRLIEFAVQNKLMSKKERLLFIPPFRSGAKWKIISEEVIGDRAEVRIKFIEHPVENIRGFGITYQFKKEGGSWKIDIEQDLSEIIKRRKNESPAEYFKNIDPGTSI